MMQRISLIKPSSSSLRFASPSSRRLCRSRSIAAAPSSVHFPLNRFKSSGISLPHLRRAVSGDSVQHQQMASDEGQQDARIARISSAIRVIPDFPKPGIMFQDITTLLLDPKAFKDTIDLFVERYKDKNVSVVAGIEARGFIFGPPIALAIGAKFVPMRKPHKLPGEVISEEYALEYGTDVMEMHVGAVQAGERALVVDDLIATGGTLNAAIRLLERVGVHVVECACVIELPELQGRQRLGDKPLFVLLRGFGKNCGETVLFALKFNRILGSVGVAIKSSILSGAFSARRDYISGRISLNKSFS